MTCTHDMYRSKPYMSDSQALKAIREKNDICHMSAIIKTCQDCGADISHGRRVRVMSVKEYMDEQ